MCGRGQISNRFSGTIPSELGLLTNLDKYLYVSACTPAFLIFFLVRLNALESTHASASVGTQALLHASTCMGRSLLESSFSGTIPSELGLLTKLDFLYVSACTSTFLLVLPVRSIACTA